MAGVEGNVQPAARAVTDGKGQESVGGVPVWLKGGDAVPLDGVALGVGVAAELLACTTV